MKWIFFILIAGIILAGCTSEQFNTDKDLIKQTTTTNVVTTVLQTTTITTIDLRKTCGDGVCQAYEGAEGCDPDPEFGGCEGYVFCPEDCLDRDMLPYP